MKKHNLAKAATVLAFTLAGINSASALTVEDESSRKGKIVSHGFPTIVEIDGKRFSYAELTMGEPELQFYEQPSPEFPGMAKFYVGEPVTKQEVVAVLEVYFDEKAFDSSSIKIRGLKLVKRGYLSWCSKPALFGCITYRTAFGNLVEYEVNGFNQSGGMAGWDRRVIIIGRLPALKAADSVLPARPPN